MGLEALQGLLSTTGTTATTNSSGINFSAIISKVAEILPSLLGNTTNQNQSLAGLDSFTSTTQETSDSEEKSSKLDTRSIISNIVSNVNWNGLISSFMG